ncbi:hypothetical protein A1O3_02482 [Capronia epimyces CBS 606.96]|uniref:Dynactin subunit 6 n=1 Tax=Capronia epimyces CBS 606.96 TaxID=1182542 RepID=W9YIE1_9EURO|nr:uncharacterized protein A1O3_02482 [Capronia epimyces CBS 606.96]EXJ89415.1 hypothetical protein A1O3_02482 [Capronia epimyces CBS 606.96]
MSAAQPAPTSTQAPSSARPPVTLGQTTHLDPGAYVRGTHGITLGEQTLVHPRAQLVAVHGPLSIGDRCIISEKCVIGGPVATDKPSEGPEGAGRGAGGSGSDESDPVKTTIHSRVYVHANAHVLAGAVIKEAVVIEPHVTVRAGVTVGSHAKICAGVTVDRDVDDWAVVYGNGDLKRQRRRKRDQSETEHAELVETMRLKAMDKEREGTMAILKMAARTATLAKKK